MGAAAGRAMCEGGTSEVVISFLDDWSTATTGTGASDIANQADADYELKYPTVVPWYYNVEESMYFSS